MQLIAQRATPEQLRLFDDIQANIINPMVWSKMLNKGILAVMARLWPQRWGRVVVIAYVIASMGPAGRSTLTNRRIAADLGMNERSVREHIISAEKEGIVERIYRVGTNRRTRLGIDPGYFLKMLAEEGEVARGRATSEGEVARGRATSEDSHLFKELDSTKRESSLLCRKAACGKPVDLDPNGKPYPYCRHCQFGAPEAAPAPQQGPRRERCIYDDCGLYEPNHVADCPRAPR